MLISRFFIKVAGKIIGLRVKDERYLLIQILTSRAHMKLVESTVSEPSERLMAPTKKVTGNKTR